MGPGKMYGILRWKMGCRVGPGFHQLREAAGSHEVIRTQERRWDLRFGMITLTNLQAWLIVYEPPVFRMDLCLGEKSSTVAY